MGASIGHTYDRQYIVELRTENPDMSIADIAREYCGKKNIDYNDNRRKSVSKVLGSVFGADEFTSETTTKQYSETGTGGLTARHPEGYVMSAEEFCKFYGLPYDEAKSYKLINTTNFVTYNIASHNVNEGDKNTVTFEDFKFGLIESVEKVANRPKTIFRNHEITDGSHLMVVDIADAHIMKLCKVYETGEEYNTEIAVKRVKDGVEGLIKKAKGFDIDKILFVAGNDILHVDNGRSTTTSGTYQNVDSKFYEGFLNAKQLYIDVIGRLLLVADVHYVFNPSNHDYISGWLLSDIIKTYYKDCENITFDCSLMHRKYYTYGQNLIGSTHGDGGKVSDLPLAMAHEAKDWSNCKHKYIYTHHIHHKVSKDYMGVCVESLRSPSATDSWHHKNLFQHAPQAVEAFIHHPINGQVARLSHIF